MPQSKNNDINEMTGWPAKDLVEFNNHHWEKKTLSGRPWVSKFPNSIRIQDLTPSFRPKVERFIQALKDAGASVAIASTLRPPKRAYLMHYSFLVARGMIAPDAVPTMGGVNIEWAHKNAKGTLDLGASRHAAQEMVRGHHIVFGPALASRHTEGNAIDMNITWSGNLTITQADGKATCISTAPLDGTNTALAGVGAGYGVYKLVTDPPHWSSDGH